MPPAARLIVVLLGHGDQSFHMRCGQGELRARRMTRLARNVRAWLSSLAGKPAAMICAGIKAASSRAACRARILTRRTSASSKPLSSAGSFESKASISRSIPEETLDVGHDELTHVLRHL